MRDLSVTGKDFKDAKYFWEIRENQSAKSRNCYDSKRSKKIKSGNRDLICT